MLALALLLAAALLCDPTSAKDKTASTDSDRQDASQKEIRLGISADFSASARALSIELYRGAMAYLLPLNNAGGVNGRQVVIKAYDDQYEPDLAIRNTLKLMAEDDVFALFSYVGTPNMNRTLPLLQIHHDKDFLLLFPFTGADTNRIPPYDQLSFNLRASYDQEMKGLVDHFVAINRTRIAVFYQADAYGRAGWGGLREALDEHGLEIAGEATYRRRSTRATIVRWRSCSDWRPMPLSVLAPIRPVVDSSATCATETSTAPSRRSRLSAAAPCSSCCPPQSGSRTRTTRPGL
jgi:ABC-type branched-subunit amino acid transport system substrate-binding protein